MSKDTEVVSTVYGDAPIKVITCDTCGQKIADHESGYFLPDGWRQLLTTETTGETLTTPGRRTRTEKHFCCDDCVVRFLAPGIYDTDPHIVAATIAKLKDMAKILQAAS